MKRLITSSLIVSTLVVGCKSKQSSPTLAPKAAAAQSNDADQSDTAQSQDSSYSPSEVMALNLQTSLINQAGLSDNDAAKIATAASSAADAALAKVLASSSSATSSTAASASIAQLVAQATAFLSSVLNQLHSGDIKIADSLKALKAIGSSTIASLKQIYISQQAGLRLGGVPDLSDPALINIASQVIGNSIASQPAAQRISDVGSLLSGAVQSVASDSLPSAQVSSILGSLGSGVLSASGKDMASADIGKLASESAKGLLSGAASITNVSTTDLAAHAQSVVQESLKAIGSLPNLDKTSAPDIIKSLTTGLVAGAGSLGKLDQAGLLALSKSAIVGISNAVQSLNVLDYVPLLDKIIAAIKEGLKAGAALVGIDAKAVDSLTINAGDLISSLANPSK